MKHIQDLGEFLESQAGDDPVAVECPECDGYGKRWSVTQRRMMVCPRCHGLGLVKNPDLEH